MANETYVQWCERMRVERRPVYSEAGGRQIPHCLNCRTDFVSIRDFRAHQPADGTDCTQMDHRYPPSGWTVEYFGQHGFGVAAFRKER